MGKVLLFKKPAFWIVLGAGITIVMAVVLSIGNAAVNKSPLLGDDILVAETDITDNGKIYFSIMGYDYNTQSIYTIHNQWDNDMSYIIGDDYTNNVEKLLKINKDKTYVSFAEGSIYSLCVADDELYYIWYAIDNDNEDVFPTNKYQLVKKTINSENEIVLTRLCNEYAVFDKATNSIFGWQKQGNGNTNKCLVKVNVMDSSISLHELSSDNKYGLAFDVIDEDIYFIIINGEVAYTKESEYTVFENTLSATICKTTFGENSEVEKLIDLPQPEKALSQDSLNYLFENTLEIRICSDYIYCGNNLIQAGNKPYVFQCKKDGSELKQLNSMPLFCQNDWAYFTDNLDIIRMYPDGSMRQIVAENVLPSPASGQRWIIPFFDEQSFGLYIQGYMSFNPLLLIKNDGTGNEAVPSISMNSNTSNTELGEAMAAYSNGWVYYALPAQPNHKAGLFRVRPDGSDNQQLLQNGIKDMLILGNKIYYLSNQNDICKINADGTNSTAICKKLSNVKLCAIENGYVYFTSSGDLYRVSTNGGIEELVFKPLYEVLLVADGMIYDNSTRELRTTVSEETYDSYGSLYVQPIDGDNDGGGGGGGDDDGKLLCDYIGIENIYQYGEWLYFAGSPIIGADDIGFPVIDNEVLARIRKNGSELTILYEANEDENSICIKGIDDKTIYFTTYDERLYRIGIDGKDKTMLVSFKETAYLETIKSYDNYFAPRLFTVADGWIYVVGKSDSETGAIYSLIRINTSNGTIETVTQ